MVERERLESEGLKKVESAEQSAEATADHTLRRHTLLSRVLRVVGGVVREQSAEAVGLAAAGATFWLVISAFPTAIAAVSLFGLVVSPEKVATDLASLASGAPASLGSLISSQLRRVAATHHDSLSLGLVASLVFALWSASAGVYNLDRAISRCLRVDTSALRGSAGARPVGCGCRSAFPWCGRPGDLRRHRAVPRSSGCRGCRAGVDGRGRCRRRDAVPVLGGHQGGDPGVGPGGRCVIGGCGGSPGRLWCLRGLVEALHSRLRRIRWSGNWDARHIPGCVRRPSGRRFERSGIG